MKPLAKLVTHSKHPIKHATVAIKSSIMPSTIKMYAAKLCAFPIQGLGYV